MAPRRRSGPPRRQRQERPRPELLVLVEGTKTEDGYLLPLRRDLRDRVIISIDARGGSPLTLVQRAVTAKQAADRESSRGRGRSYDAVWCIFDRDIHPNVPEALALASGHAWSGCRAKHRPPDRGICDASGRRCNAWPAPTGDRPLGQARQARPPPRWTCTGEFRAPLRSDSPTVEPTTSAVSGGLWPTPPDLFGQRIVSRGTR